MGKATKQTKKFLKNGLEKEYERRNKARPLKQAFAKRQKKKLDKLNAPPKDGRFIQQMNLLILILSYYYFFRV